MLAVCGDDPGADRLARLTAATDATSPRDHRARASQAGGRHAAVIGQRPDNPSAVDVGSPARRASRLVRTLSSTVAALVIPFGDWRLTRPYAESMRTTGLGAIWLFQPEPTPSTSSPQRTRQNSDPQGGTEQQSQFVQLRAMRSRYSPTDGTSTTASTSRRAVTKPGRSSTAVTCRISRSIDQ